MMSESIRGPSGDAREPGHVAARWCRRFDQRSAAVLANTSGAVILPIFPVIYPAMVRPGLMVWLLIIWAYSALSMVVTAAVGRLTDWQFIILGAGGMVGVAGSAYVLVDAGTSHAVLVLLAAIPALAAMHSRPAIVAGFVVTALILATAVSATTAPSWPELVVAGGATTMAVLIPTVLIAALRRTLMALVERLETIGDTDPLTGCWNRRGMETRLEYLLDAAVHGNRGLGAAIIDIDFFKTVNDRFGHSVGDQVLIDVAEAVHVSTPADSIVARIGGEEFLVLALVDDERDIADIAEAARAWAAETTTVTVSVGAVYAGVCAAAPARSQRSPRQRGRELVDALSRAADRLLYVSKAEGRDRVGCGSVPTIQWQARPAMRNQRSIGRDVSTSRGDNRARKDTMRHDRE